MDVKMLAETYIKQFNKAFGMAAKNIQGGRLRRYCEVQTLDEGEAAIFFRSSGQKARDKAVNIYDSGATNFIAEGEGDGFANTSYEVAIRDVYWAEVLPIRNITKSMFKPESSFMAQAKSSLDLKEDIEIINAFAARKADVALPLGDNTKVISDASNIADFQVCAMYVQSLAKTAFSGAEHPAKDAVAIMNQMDYLELLKASSGTGTSDLLSNQSFTHITDRSGMLVSKLFGVNLEVYSQHEKPANWGSKTSPIESGNVYFMTTNAMAFAEWKGSVMSTSKYDFFNDDKIAFGAKKSVGAKLIDVYNCATLSTLVSPLVAKLQINE